MNELQSSLLLSAVLKAQREQERVMVAIDGPCASGKSTLAPLWPKSWAALCSTWTTFLPPAQKTPQRLAEPGGNVDAERFFAEVLLPFSRGEAVHYRPYRCHEGRLADAIQVPPTKLAAVEGVYAMPPRPAAPITRSPASLEAPGPVRRERLLERGGAECLRRFEELWIPLEDRYFQASPSRISASWCWTAPTKEKAPRRTEVRGALLLFSHKGPQLLVGLGQVPAHGQVLGHSRSHWPQR